MQADRDQIHAVVLNFVKNAIEAMTEVSECERVLAVECRLENPETLVVSVRDSGTGIAAQDRKHAFDPFYTSTFHFYPAVRRGNIAWRAKSCPGVCRRILHLTPYATGTRKQVLELPRVSRMAYRLRRAAWHRVSS